MNKKKEKLWLRCVNLGCSPGDAEIKEFLDYPIAFDDLEVEILGKKIQANIIPDKPSLNEFKEWHAKFMSIFQRYLTTKWHEEDPIANAFKGDINWLNNYSLQVERKLHTSPTRQNWIYFVEVRLDEKLSLMSYVVAQFIGYVASGQELRQCAAVGCERYFIPNPRGREQLYCSRQCNRREYMRDYRKNNL